MIGLVVPAAALALFIEATSGDVEPEWLYAVIVPVWVLGPLALGFRKRWRALAVVAVAYVAIAIAHEEFLYDQPSGECDPFCASPVDGIFFLLPVLLVLVAIGAGVGAHVDRRSARRHH